MVLHSACMQTSNEGSLTPHLLPQSGAAAGAWQPQRLGTETAKAHSAQMSVARLRCVGGVSESSKQGRASAQPHTKEDEQSRASKA